MSHPTAEDAHARIDRDVAAAHARAEAAAEFRRNVDAARGTATVDGVTATVDASGALTALTLPERLEHRRSTTLAASILAATRAAYADIAAQVQVMAGETFGADSPVADRMRSELERRAAVLESGPASPGATEHVLR